MTGTVLRLATALAVLSLAACGSGATPGESQSGSGSLGASADGGTPGSDAGFALSFCLREACPSPAPEAPNFVCADGSLAGPACVRFTDGTCAWRLLSCP